MIEFKDVKSGGGRLVAALLFFVGLLQVAGYYLSGALVNGDGPLAVPQPDTLLYMQAARRIVEGHAFSFSAGVAASTGTTSVLYPFVLAVPYAFGATGDSLVAAGFALNAVFYLVFLFGWGFALTRILEGRGVVLAALALLALSPQPAYCALSQSDIGLWMAVSGLFAAAFAGERPVVCAVLLALGPWVRPEGMILVVAFCAYAVFVRRRSEVVTAAVGVLSVVGVFALNVVLSGRAQFSSVANKGHFTVYSLPQAVYMTAVDLIQTLKGFALGLSDQPPRVFFVIPVLGALFFLWGLFAHDWNRRTGPRTLALLLAALGGVATVAMSGWQNTNMDRYIAWIFPLVAAFVAEGAVRVAACVPDSGARRVVLSLPCLYAACASVVMFAVYHGNSRDSALIQEFARDCESLMPPGASVGGQARSGMAYEFSDRRFAHLSGIYSPEFRAKEPLAAVEILKNEPETRFDYWILTPDSGFGAAFGDATGEQVAVGPLGMELRKARWAALDEAAKAPDAKGLSLVSRVDVGYEKDEKAADYRSVQKYSHKDFDPFVKVAEGKDGRKMVEVARMVAGCDEMSVPLAPGRDVRVVMRTFGACDVVSRGSFASSRVSYAIASPARMNIAVDGRLVSSAEFSCATNSFSDVEMTIPGSAIAAPLSRVAFLGDHIACGYWFYQ
ncbi:MAG: hypothetical protein IJ829_08825 [Kiritimatiellae bacterium]|nr:hypothetical protein [Kiritimatiellia bacterium]